MTAGLDIWRYTVSTEECRAGVFISLQEEEERRWRSTCIFMQKERW